MRGQLEPALRQRTMRFTRVAPDTGLVALSITTANILAPIEAFSFSALQSDELRPELVPSKIVANTRRMRNRVSFAFVVARGGLPLP